MRKSLLAVALATVFLAGCDGIVPDIQNNALVEPVYEYEIDTWGSNSEVYEFTPKSNTSMSCVVYILDNTRAMGMQCFPKGVVNAGS